MVAQEADGVGEEIGRKQVCRRAGTGAYGQVLDDRARGLGWPGRVGLAADFGGDGLLEGEVVGGVGGGGPGEAHVRADAVGAEIFHGGRQVERRGFGRPRIGASGDADGHRKKERHTGDAPPKTG